MRKLLSYLVVAMLVVSMLSGVAYAEAKTYKIAFAVPYPAHAAWQNIKLGAEDAAKYFSNNDHKFEILWNGPTTAGDAVAQADVMSGYIAQGVDAIVFCPESESAFSTVCMDSKTAGIPMFTFGADMSSTPDLRVSFVGTDNSLVGRQQIEGIHKALGTDDLKVCVLMSKLDSSNQVAQVDAFRAYIDELKAKGADAELLEVRDDNGGSDAIYVIDVVMGMIQAHPDCNVILSTHGDCGPKIAKAVEETGNAGKILFSSYDDMPDCLDCVRQGKEYSLMVQNFYNWGFGPASLAIRYLTGETVDSFYNAGCVEVTKENVDSYAPQMVEMSKLFK